MKLSEIKQTVGHLQTSASENPLVAGAIVAAVLLIVVVLGGLLLDGFLEWKHQRQKAKAVERLQKHLQSLPSIKS
jgi:hypothetical protein